MELINTIFDKKATGKPDMEQVENEQQEWKLIGKFLRTKGLKLFAYNYLTERLIELEPRNKDAIHLVISEDNKLTPVDVGFEEVEVDSRNIHFESLNMKNAVKRVKKYRGGRLRELCNLRVANPESIKLF